MEFISEKQENVLVYSFVKDDLVLSSARCREISLNNIVNYLTNEELGNIRNFDLCEEDKNLTDDAILKDYEENFEGIYELKNTLISKNINKVLYIDLISNNSTIKGLGTKLFNKITKDYDCVMLLPLSDVIEFWENLGFKEISNNYMALVK